LADFGFAKQLESQDNKEVAALGTLYYRAPEILKH